jgi:hypothetical protein
MVVKCGLLSSPLIGRSCGADGRPEAPTSGASKSVPRNQLACRPAGRTRIGQGALPARLVRPKQRGQLLAMYALLGDEMDMAEAEGLTWHLAVPRTSSQPAVRAFFIHGMRSLEILLVATINRFCSETTVAVSPTCCCRHADFDS